jgi:prepilin-type N-terminal cleavage/methylation domain-containing protein
MKGAPGGFTIIEVMIVLAISGTMLISASTLLSSRRQATDFSQAVYDLQSQIQSLANSVSSQAIPGVQHFTCAPYSIDSVMRPALSPGTATNQDCIFLGQAIQVKADSSSLYSYPIFGLRTVYNGFSDTDEAPATFGDAHPLPAMSSAAASSPNDPANMRLVNNYTMLNGLKTVWAKYKTTDNYILTMFSSLQDSNTSGNEISVSATNYVGLQSDLGLQMKECMESIGVVAPPPPCATFSPVTNTAWQLCVTDGSPRQALLSVKAIATGLATTLNMNGCT